MLLRLCRGKSRRKRDFRKVLNRVGTDGATNWLRAKLLAFQFAVLRAKVRGAVAAAYFGMRPVISSPRRNPHTHTVRPKSGLLREVLKFGHAFSGRQGGKEVYEPEASKGERTKLRMAGEECCRQETEKEGEWKKEGRGKKLCHRPR